MNHITKKKNGLGAAAMLRQQVQKSDRVKKAKSVDRVVVHWTGGRAEHLVLVLDYSGSMFMQMDNSDHRSPMVITVLREAAVELVTASRSSIVAAVAYGSEAEMLVDFHEGKRLEKAMADLPSLGMTHGYNGLNIAYEMLSMEGQRRIIYMSDGRDGNPERTLEVARLFHKAGITIDAVAFGPKADRDFLRQLCGSDGVLKEADDAASLKRSFLALEAGTRGLLGAG
jgi:Mg-chelatase subunit ChlD